MFNNNVLASFDAYNLPFHGVRLPSFVIQEEDRKALGVDSSISNFDFLRKLCLNGFKKLNLKKDSPEYKRYAERAKYELDTLNELGFVDYILLVWTVMNFCKKRDIPVGKGRGSAAGSLVLFLIGATGIDPIKYDLFFERFISKTRAKKQVIDGVTYLDGSLMCDVDMDICYYRRHEVIEYLNTLFPNKTSKILTLNTLSGKLLIKECGKVVGDKSETEMTEVAGLIPKIFGKVKDIEEAYETVPEFKAWCDENKRIYNIALKLRDLVKNKGMHASGVLISYDDLQDNCPVEFSSDKSHVSGFDMNWVSLINVKLDCLGLRSVSVVDDVCKHVGIKMDDIDINDPLIYQNLYDLKTPHGLFQIEADTGFKATQKIKPKSLEELSGVLAIARPGAMQFLDDYANFTNTGVSKDIHPFFNDVFSVTGNLCLYQEQLLSAIKKIGFSAEEAEIVRRCVTGDTVFISKTRGYVSINTLISTGYKDELFLTLDELGNKKWQKIKDIWSNGMKQIRYVEANNGLSVKATLHHQFLTDTGWKARLRLTENDYLYTPKSVEWDGQDLISRDLAIIISGLATEGYFSGYGTTTFTNYEPSILKMFNDSFFNVFNKYATVRPCGKVVAIKKQETEFINKYLNYGLSASKILPEIMMGMTKETTRDFLSFILACEGGVSQSNIGNQRWFELSSKSEKFAQQIQLLLLRFGIHSKLRKKKNPKYGWFYYILIKEYNLLKLLNQELTNMWPDSKKEQLNKLLETERALHTSFDMIPQSVLKKLISQYPFITSGESGRLYKKPCNKETFKKLCLKSGDKKWIEFSNKDFIFNKFSNQDRDIREVEVFDFTMEDEESPFIIANGIVIHNCVGKKKVDEMKVWKEKISKKVLENKLDPSISDTIWNIAEASANYSFNCSHSISYATLSALTVYLKFKYPKEFFLSLLKMCKHEPDPRAEIAKIHKELRHFNINLLSPDIIKSDMDFKIEGDDIRFGLYFIKGISEKSINKLNDFKKEYSNKFKLFQSAEEAGLSISMLSALIQAGAIDGYKDNRSYTVMQAQLWNILSDNEKKIAMSLGQEYRYNLVTTVKAMTQKLNEKGKPIIKESRLETIKKKYQPFKLIYDLNSKNEQFASWYYEKKLIGYACSQTLKDIFCDKYKHLKDISEAIDCQNDYEIRFVCTVEEKTIGVSKTKGTRYMKLLVSDETGMMNVLCFNDSIDEIKSINGDQLPKEGNIIYVSGKKRNDSVMANIIYIQDNKIYIKFGDLKNSEEKIEA